MNSHFRFECFCSIFTAINRVKTYNIQHNNQRYTIENHNTVYVLGSYLRFVTFQWENLNCVRYIMCSICNTVTYQNIKYYTQQQQLWAEFSDLIRRCLPYCICKIHVCFISNVYHAGGWFFTFNVYIERCICQTLDITANILHIHLCVIFKVLQKPSIVILELDYSIDVIHKHIIYI